MLVTTEKELTATERAKTEVQHLADREGELISQRRAALATLEQLERAAGDAYLAGDSEKGVDQVVQTKAKINALARAIGTARERRMEAVANRYSTEAGELRKQAKNLRAEAEEINRKTEPLLRKLSEIEGIEYTRSILLAQRDANWLPSPVFGKPIDQCGPTEVIPNLPGATYLVPRSAALEASAAELERRAVSIEGTKVQRSGSITVNSLQAGVDAIALRSDQLLPTQDSMEDWGVRIEAKIAKRPELARHMRQYKIVWQDGELDEAESSVTMLRSGHIGGDAVFRCGAVQ